MYPVSTAFLTAVKENTRKYYWTGRITTKAGDVYDFDQNDIVRGSGYITSRCCGNTEIELGTVYASELEISLFSEIDRYTLEDAMVTLSYHLQVEDGNYEEAPMGGFEVSEANRKAKCLEIKAYDYMLRFEKNFNGFETIGTGFDFVNLCCQACGVEMAQDQAFYESLPNGTENRSIYSDNDIETYRDVLYFVAQVLGDFFVINREGKLELRKYGNASVLTVERKHRFTSSFSDFITRYTAVSSTNQRTQTAEYYALDPDDGLIMNLGINPLLRFGLEETRGQLINEHDGTYESEEQITNGWKKRVSIQGHRKDMHFEIACVNEEPFGIVMFAIDLGTVYDLLEKGYGTIMGFYIHPKFRRKGLGTSFSKHIEATLYSDGARKMYICPDSVTGEPFWKANGYTDSGKIDPDDKKSIYIKEIACLIDFTNCLMIPMTQDAALEISQWEYEKPCDAYNFKGHPNGYLRDESAWGTEQFCLVDNEEISGQVSCQCDGADLWGGWSMTPQLCGKGNGAAVIEKCVKELRYMKGHTGRIVLRVAAWNQRAIHAYQKAGFNYVETIQDEIAYSNHMEDFLVMELL